MGTRGLFGVIIDGQRYACFHRQDSYPDYLGRRLMEFVNSLTREQCAKMATLVRDIEWIAGDLQSESMEILPAILNERQNNCLVESVQFLENSRACEWAYFIDFDEENFEVWSRGKFIQEITFQDLKEQVDSFVEDLEKVEVEVWR